MDSSSVPMVFLFPEKGRRAGQKPPTGLAIENRLCQPDNFANF